MGVGGQLLEVFMEAERRAGTVPWVFVSGCISRCGQKGVLAQCRAPPGICS